MFLCLLLAQSFLTMFIAQNPIIMSIGEKIRKARLARKLSQKEVALSLEMDPAQYSRIETGKSDPYFSTVEKIAQALGVEIAVLLDERDVFNVNSANKSVMEKLQLLELLDEEEQQSLFRIIDGLVSKQRLKDNLTNVLQSA